MSINLRAGNIFDGLAADKASLTLAPANSLFLETDTKLGYLFDGSSWNDLGYLKLTGGSITGDLSLTGKFTATSELHEFITQSGVTSTSRGVRITPSSGSGHHLVLGRHEDYGWIQTYGSTPLKLNPEGNEVHVGYDLVVGSDVNSTSGTFQINGTTVIDSGRNFSGVGAIFDGGTNTTVTILSNDDGESVLNLIGDTQGTGRVYVGRSLTHGGGIEYNGDGSPIGSGSGSDYITLYRRTDGVDSWTARSLVNSNNWEFRGTLTATSFIGSGASLTGISDSQIGGLSTSLASKADMAQTPSVNPVGPGWFRIAEGNTRSFGRFGIKCETSGNHDALEFIASCSYNYNPVLTVLSRGTYSSSRFDKIRLIANNTVGTSAPYYIEIYLDGATNTNCVAYLWDNIQNVNGWTLINWTAGSIPTGYTAEEITLTEYGITSNKGAEFGGNLSIGGDISAQEGEFTDLYTTGDLFSNTTGRSAYFANVEIDNNLQISGVTTLLGNISAPSMTLTGDLTTSGNLTTSGGIYTTDILVPNYGDMGPFPSYTTLDIVSSDQNDVRLNLLSGLSSKILLNTNGDSYLNGGNLGIGISPTSKLDVSYTQTEVGTILGANAVGLRVTRSEAASDAYASIIGLEAYNGKGATLQAGGYGFNIFHWDGTTRNEILSITSAGDTTLIGTLTVDDGITSTNGDVTAIDGTFSENLTVGSPGSYDFRVKPGGVEIGNNSNSWASGMLAVGSHLGASQAGTINSSQSSIINLARNTTTNSLNYLYASDGGYLTISINKTVFINMKAMAVSNETRDIAVWDLNIIAQNTSAGFSIIKISDATSTTSYTVGTRINGNILDESMGAFDLTFTTSASNLMVGAYGNSGESINWNATLYINEINGPEDAGYGEGYGL